MPRETECWVRNPVPYIKQCLDAGVTRYIFMKAHETRFSVDAWKFLDIHARGVPFRLLRTNLADRVTFEYDNSSPEPIAKWPHWAYGQSMLTLRKLVDWAEEERGRIMVVGLPSMGEGPVAHFLAILADLQEQHPRAQIHLNRISTYRMAFGLQLAAADLNLETRYGTLWLPNGTRTAADKLVREDEFWIKLVGFKPSQLLKEENRTAFNIASMQWAQRNFMSPELFPLRSGYLRDQDGNVITRSTKASRIRWKPAKDGDFFACDVCSLRRDCRVFREGSVCAVGGTPGKMVGEDFGTRNADRIINGLSSLLVLQTERLDKALEREETTEFLDPNVTKLIESTFDRGKDLAKLIDPQRFSVQRVVEEATPISGATPKQLMANIVRRLEAAGVARATITPEMVSKVLVASATEEDMDRVISEIVTLALGPSDV